MLHLKKFLAHKLALPRPEAVDVLCRGEVLGREYTLLFVAKTRWHTDGPLALSYRAHVDL